MFEPNPDCVSILKVNSKIALRNKAYVINEFGLGLKRETLKLYVPYDNWGGAFIKSLDNEYDENLLSKKDGYGDFNKNNYQVLDVQVESATDTLSQLFGDLAKRGKTKGVIKIDVEGYEKLVLDAISETVPDNFQLCVIFENWDANKTIPDLSINSKQDKSFYKLTESKIKLKFLPRWLNSIFTLIKGGHATNLKPVTNEINAGTYVLTIQPSFL